MTQRDIDLVHDDTAFMVPPMSIKLIDSLTFLLVIGGYGALCFIFQGA